jgi:hypothetical protein
MERPIPMKTENGLYRVADAAGDGLARNFGTFG